MADTTKKFSMKLLVDKRTRRVVFAEANKDVVDLLSSLLALPIGRVVQLIGKESMAGSAGDLYSSIKKLDTTYIQPGAAKDAFLHPDVPSLPPAAASVSSVLCLPAPSKTFFKCSESHSAGYYSKGNHMTDVSGTKCPSCSRKMTSAVPYKYVAPGHGAGGGGGERGLVRGGATYMVTDSLAITPISAISIITLLNAHAVPDLAALQEKTVQIGRNELLGILSASLQSKTVLTDVFLGKMPRTTTKT